MIVSEQKPIKFINSCGCTVDYEELSKAILWYQKKPTASTKKIYIHGRYPAVSIYHEKIHIHRLLMMFWLRTALPQDFVVHHIDGKRLNASKDNLVVLHISKHQSYHNKGRKLSKEHCLKIAENNRLRKGKKHRTKRTDITPRMVYQLKQQGMSFNQISIKHGMDWGCVKQRYDDFIHDNSELLGGAE